MAMLLDGIIHLYIHWLFRVVGLHGRRSQPSRRTGVKVTLLSAPL